MKEVKQGNSITIWGNNLLYGKGLARWQVKYQLNDYCVIRQEMMELALNIARETEGSTMA